MNLYQQVGGVDVHICIRSFPQDVDPSSQLADKGQHKMFYCRVISHIPLAQQSVKVAPTCTGW